jgi:hypothetical protein
MPVGPRGEKRPRDVIGTAVKAMRIATGEIEEDIDPKSAASSTASKSWSRPVDFPACRKGPDEPTYLDPPVRGRHSYIAR